MSSDLAGKCCFFFFFYSCVTSFICCKWLSSFLMNSALACSAAALARLRFLILSSCCHVGKRSRQGLPPSSPFWCISSLTDNTTTLAIIPLVMLALKGLFLKEALGLLLKTRSEDKGLLEHISEVVLLLKQMLFACLIVKLKHRTTAASQYLEMQEAKKSNRCTSEKTVNIKS